MVSFNSNFDQMHKIYTSVFRELAYFRRLLIAGVIQNKIKIINIINIKIIYIYYSELFKNLAEINLILLFLYRFKIRIKEGSCFALNF